MHIDTRTQLTNETEDRESLSTAAQLAGNFYRSVLSAFSPFQHRISLKWLEMNTNLKFSAVILASANIVTGVPISLWPHERRTQNCEIWLEVIYSIIFLLTVCE